ncbi:DUF262 domain-containing protein [Octadecabacter sp. SW4]|uniref:DUF262 domain-containing protein n=1 Tax=Octadecabacter sp. SW4 TaxID=2602067 RepID=UPI0011C1DF04|nr:DUF262 domain-containing protein [Octadecabacter sp. SW4]QEE34998.1 DUF262 domain-containing protein [Octadecabacter sp. SW4]
MQDIQGDDKTLEVLLSGSAFGIDYYQREYRWKRKQLQELVDDLYGQFSQTYGPGIPLEKQSKYFLGSIVISKAGDVRNIVDGQQRITTLTLLLIYLNHLQKDHAKKVNKIEQLVYDEDPGGPKFKLDIPERNDCMSALLNGDSYNPEGKSDSVRNLVDRYDDLADIFPTDMEPDALHMFIWWIIRNVKLIEITANDDGDAYTIFETMNDRGLSLTPTDMLKGYLLANIENPGKRLEADKLIKSYLTKFAEHGENTESDFFKAWLRSQYAKKIRERKKEAQNEDFELIGTEYHRWVKNHEGEVGLNSGEDFYQFVIKNMRIFADLYLRLLKASATRKKGLESVKYNADAGFTLQHHIILSAVNVDDDKETALAKMGLVADFIDSWLNVRLWNFKMTSYSHMQYAAFTVIRSVRGKSLTELRNVLHKRLLEEMVEIRFTGNFGLTKTNGKTVQRMLARFTDWLEQQAGEPGRYEDYIVRSGKNAYEVEHILANKFEMFAEEFEDAHAFEEWRNYIGGLLLLPKKVNASLGDYSYEKKLPHYLKANALTHSLHPNFYQNNPGVLNAIKRHGLAFEAHEKFDGDDIEQRSELYSALASLIWSPDRLLAEEV